MAIIIPFGDANAHGTIGGAITFRRRFGRVILETKPHPKKTNTPAQIIQREKFSTAQQDWYSYDSLSKEYYNLRGPELHMSAKNLFTQAKLLNNMPNQTPAGVRHIIQAQIIKTVCPAFDTGGLGFSIWDSVSSFWLSQGTIWDNQNIFNPGSEGASTYSHLKISFDTDTYDLFRYGVWLQVKNNDNSISELIVRVKSPMAPKIYVYISLDGSSFDDEALTHLNATNNF